MSRAPAGALVKLRTAAALCATTSVAALVAHVVAGVPLVFSLTFVGVPSVLLLFSLAAFGRRIDAAVFVRCLRIGAVAGAVATAAYDGARLLIRWSRLLDYDGFMAIYLFGSWITGEPPTALAAGVAGWIYHFWNGIGFGVFYALIVGRGSWLHGLVYGLLMEACMLGLFPMFLRVSNRVDFITVSLLGHAVYGLVLGCIVQRHGVGWSEGRLA